MIGKFFMAATLGQINIIIVWDPSINYLYRGDLHALSRKRQKSNYMSCAGLPLVAYRWINFTRKLIQGGGSRCAPCLQHLGIMVVVTVGRGSREISSQAARTQLGPWYGLGILHGRGAGLELTP